MAKDVDGETFFGSGSVDSKMAHSLQEAFHFFAALRLAAACETTRESRLL